LNYIPEKQQTVYKFVQQCWFLKSEDITSKFADQADNIVPFTFQKKRSTN